MPRPEYTVPEHLTVGMRFHPGDAHRLEVLAEECARREVPGAVALFREAAIAARTREPWIVHCRDRAEAERLAAEFGRQGVERPTLDEVHTAE